MVTVRESEYLHYNSQGVWTVALWVLFGFFFLCDWIWNSSFVQSFSLYIYEVGFSSLLSVFPVGFLNLQVILDECDFFIFNIIIFIYQWQALLFTTWYARLKAYVILLGHFLYPDLWREKIAIYNLDFILQLVFIFCIIVSGIIRITFRFHSFFLIPFDYNTQVFVKL